ncbi:MAG: UDP-glucose 4-epimerase GalE [Ottowia sp.]|nr:UDP-glucose 4-epimerase GalE [Ottowia sp.]
MKNILVTGGAGFIGSHTVLKLLSAGHSVVIFDNLSNSSPAAVDRVARLAGVTVPFVQGDIRDREAVRKCLAEHAIQSVIHFAGLKAVGESESEPLKYYDNNVNGSVVLFEEMENAGVRSIVFSSSATVYGDPGYPQYREDTPLAPVNVYGRTKRIIEDILRDLHRANPAWRMALLRYFNPVGAHSSGQIGEDPQGVPNNLMPYLAQVASGVRPELQVFGGDYPTPDGTGMRDYIHVEDLADGHLAALKYIESESAQDILTLNLGRGQPYSVLEMVRAFEAATGKAIPHRIAPRRAGDLAQFYADPSLAEKTLGWKAELGIERMCMDTWRWQKSQATA